MIFRASRRAFGGWTAAALLTPWLAACGGASDAELDREQAYQDAVQRLQERYQPPGLLVAVSRPGVRTWEGGYGFADLEAQAVMPLDAHFPIRSITKSFTVTLLLQLARDGRLSLDDKIAIHVAGVPNGELISLADLAGNQSGLADYSQQPAFTQALSEDWAREWLPQELLAVAFAQAPGFLPGEQYQYCNTNTVLLGVMMEGLTKQPLAELLEQRIFSPLALDNSDYPASPELPAPMARPYGLDIDSGVTEVLPSLSPSALAGSGAMASTLGDLLIWGEALGSGTLLGPEWQARRIAQPRLVTNGPEYQRYALGIGQIGRWWGHTGSGLGYQVATMHLPQVQATIAVMVNASPEGGRRDLNLAQELFESLADVVETGSTAATPA